MATPPKRPIRPAAHLPRAKLVERAASAAALTPSRADVIASSARDVREAEKLVAEIEQLRAQRLRCSFEMGVRFERLSQPVMYRALGYESFDDLVLDRDLSHPMTATQLIRVAQDLDEATVRELGVEKAYAFIRYLEAKYPRAKPLAIAKKNPLISGLGKRLADVSPNELRKAKRALAPPKTTTSMTPPVEVESAANELRKALRDAGLGRVSVTTHRVSGKWIVRTELSAKQASDVAEQLR